MAKEQLIACAVQRDYWIAAEQATALDRDQRVRAGEIVEVDADAAIAGIETGTLKRVK